MALLASLAALLAVGLFALIAAALGHRILRLSSLESVSEAENLLCSAAVGVICIGLLLFPIQMLGHIRTGVIAVIVLSLLLGLGNFMTVLEKVLRLLRNCFLGSRLENFLAIATLAVLLTEGLAAMAPLAGSDALHYHFTAPRLILLLGFHPNFFLSTSFLTGQSHLLILAGLALGSSQLAMGLLFLGGVLAAVACACLVRRWASRQWALTAALTFLLTPVTFWQISSAGAPDMWMAFFVTVGVLVISQSKNLPHASHAVLSGALAGALAGAKYTGCIIAASMAVAYVWESRSIRKLLLFFLGSLISGVWPYARNFAWTGDPVFPFLLRHLSPGKLNAFALASYLAETGAGQHLSFWQILKFPLFAAIDTQHPGFWQFLGPLVLCFAPLLILAVRNTTAWRVALTVWILSALGIGVSSGMSRYVFPLLPCALAGVFAGVSHLATRGWRAAKYISAATISGFLLFGAAGLLFYDRAALLVAGGFTSQDEYMREHVPEYEKTEFVNRVLSEKEAGGKTLVFMRHVFYLRVPFLYGDPSASWAVDPSELQTPEEWQAFFQAHDIRWVVRSPEYPEAIAAPLKQLETSGQLSPIARSEISDFQGSRVYGQRQTVAVTILQVNH
ncbi:MAG TPA: hypothetical protein VFN26_07445 [Candidatus Acidoferrum sp.]|nr:hypothetical protein [Candidatus Acidoferrum sp.]